MDISETVKLKPQIPDFESAIWISVKIVRDALENDELPISIIRDYLGQVIVVVSGTHLEGKSDDFIETLASHLHTRLGIYSPGHPFVLLRESDLIDSEILGEQSEKYESDFDENVFILDTHKSKMARKHSQIELPSGPKIVSAFGFRGGLGRTTAAALWSIYLAGKGYKVCLIDMNLGASDIPEWFISDQQKPLHGMLDWIIESQIRLSAKQELRLPESVFISDTPISEWIQIIPAWGQLTSEKVEKLSRLGWPVYSENHDQIYELHYIIRVLIKMLSESDNSPDVILFDLPTGLSEISTNVLSQKESSILLFGRSESELAMNQYLLSQSLISYEDSEELSERIIPVEVSDQPSGSEISIFKDPSVFRHFSSKSIRDSSNTHLDFFKDVTKRIGL